jgi:hypothetical protein
VLVKTWRIWLILLMAVLIPVRGAAAASVLCPIGSSGSSARIHVVDNVPTHNARDEARANHHAEISEQASELDHACDSTGEERNSDEHAANDGCKTCAAHCSVIPLLSSLPIIPQPFDWALGKFSELRDASSSFVADGEDPPPRTK